MTIPSSFPISLSLCKDRPTTAERGKTSLPPYGGSSHLSSLCLVPPSLPPSYPSLTLSPLPQSGNSGLPKRSEGEGRGRREREPLAALRFPRQKKGGAKSAFFPTLARPLLSLFLPVCPSSTVQNRQLSVSPLPRAAHSVKCLRCVRGE